MYISTSAEGDNGDDRTRDKEKKKENPKRRVDVFYI